MTTLSAECGGRASTSHHAICQPESATSVGHTCVTVRGQGHVVVHAPGVLRLLVQPDGDDNDPRTLTDDPPRGDRGFRAREPSVDECVGADSEGNRSSTVIVVDPSSSESSSGADGTVSSSPHLLASNTCIIQISSTPSPVSSASSVDSGTADLVEDQNTARTSFNNGSTNRTLVRDSVPVEFAGLKITSTTTPLNRVRSKSSAIVSRLPVIEERSVSSL